MDHDYPRPLDEIEIVGLLLKATVAFDCSGARFTEDVGEKEAEVLLDLLEGLGGRLYFAAETVTEIERMVRRKIGDAREVLGRDRSRLLIAEKTILSVRTTFEKLPELEKLFSEFYEQLYSKYNSYEVGLSGIANRLINIARRRAGPSFDAAELARAHAEARSRFDSNIPPGFCDDQAWCNRNGHHNARSKRQPESFGDYVVWKQLMKRAATSEMPILLVTNDLKNDWWEHDVTGTPIAPLAALQKEMQRTTGQIYYAITFADFRRLAPQTLLPAERTELVAVSATLPILSGSSAWRPSVRDSIPAWMLAAQLRTFSTSILNARRPDAEGLHRIIKDLAQDPTRRTVCDMLGSDPMRYAREAHLTRSISPLNRIISDLTESSNYPSIVHMLARSDNVRRFAAIEALRPGYPFPGALGVIDSLRDGSPLARHVGLANTGRSSGMLKSIQEIMMLNSGFSPTRSLTSNADSIERFQENERHLVEIALGKGAELIGKSAISHPKIREFAETHGLMDLPVRKIAAAMRDDRLRTEESGITSDALKRNEGGGN